MIAGQVDIINTGNIIFKYLPLQPPNNHRTNNSWYSGSLIFAELAVHQPCPDMAML